MSEKLVKVGVIAKKSNISTRLVRYYEDLGLISSERDEYNYRLYQEKDTLFRIKLVRDLLACGLNTVIIKTLMPCLVISQDILPKSVSSVTYDTLLERKASLEKQIVTLTNALDGVSDYLKKIERLPRVQK